MKTTAIASEKGGVGKTTTTINLAAALAQRGRRVLLVDLDGQCSLSDRRGIAEAELVRLDDERKTIYFALFEGATPETIALDKSTALVPGSPRMAGAEGQIQSDPINGLHRLREFIDRQANGFDHVLIDCPPTLCLRTLSALIAADDVIVPVKTDPNALKGFLDVLRTIRDVRKRHNPALHVAGILPTSFKKGYFRDAEALETLRKATGEHHQRLFEPVPQNAVIDHAQALCTSAVAYEPTSSAAMAYMALADNLIAYAAEAA
jgi:chromosome partitioning protein